MGWAGIGDGTRAQAAAEYADWRELGDRGPAGGAIRGRRRGAQCPVVACGPDPARRGYHGAKMARRKTLPDPRQMAGLPGAAEPAGPSTGQCRPGIGRRTENGKLVHRADRAGRGADRWTETW